MQPDYQFVGYAEAVNVVLREPKKNCIPGFALGKLHIVLRKASRWWVRLPPLSLTTVRTIRNGIYKTCIGTMQAAMTDVIIKSSTGATPRQTHEHQRPTHVTQCNEMMQVVLSMTRNCSHSLRLNNLQRNANGNVKTRMVTGSSKVL